jgi:hypothetical protein
VLRQRVKYILGGLEACASAPEIIRFLVGFGALFQYYTGYCCESCECALSLKMPPPHRWDGSRHSGPRECKWESEDVLRFRGCVTIGRISRNIWYIFSKAEKLSWTSVSASCLLGRNKVDRICTCNRLYYGLWKFFPPAPPVLKARKTAIFIDTLL